MILASRVAPRFSLMEMAIRRPCEPSPLLCSSCSQELASLGSTESVQLPWERSLMKKLAPSAEMALILLSEGGKESCSWSEGRIG